MSEPNIVECAACHGSGRDYFYCADDDGKHDDCRACGGLGHYDAGPASALPWHCSYLKHGLVIHGDFDGDADDEGRSIDCTDYIADMRDTGRADANAALIVLAVNCHAELVAAAKAALRFIWREGYADAHPEVAELERVTKPHWTEADSAPEGRNSDTGTQQRSVTE